MCEGMYRKNLAPGMLVEIIMKKDYGTDHLITGEIERVLTNKAVHTRGIKVKLVEGGRVGRVVHIIPEER